jgi:hypothetical protein
MYFWSPKIYVVLGPTQNMCFWPRENIPDERTSSLHLELEREQLQAAETKAEKDVAAPKHASHLSH